MPSLLPGYACDIFISYRQKDNRSDQWVTQFVQALRDELDSTFKEEISIYFDANPHDGLSETHDVDGSLKEKIKALILIPIVSQTYCDPNVFAWKNEYLAFLDFARGDGIGLDVHLAGGNVAKRVLPVRIHELDGSDRELFEKALGGVMRSVDFIYREPGVNRPLRLKDDDTKEVSHALFYRDQINKVANGVKELLHGIQRKPAPAARPAVESPPRRTKTPKPSSSKRPWGWGAGVLGLLVIAAWFYLSFGKPSQAELKAVWLSKLRRAIDEHSFNFGPGRVSDITTYRLAVEARKLLGDDPDLMALFPWATHPLSIYTDPPGAEVSWRVYEDPPESLISLGTAPVKNIDMPNDASIVRIARQGYDTVWIFNGLDTAINIIMDAVGKKEPGQIRVAGTESAGLLLWGLEHHSGPAIPDFLIDRMEVTNREFKKFVDTGGYKDPSFWKHPIDDGGKRLALTDALKLFVDKTGRPGPSTWEAGTYPDGLADHPVSGVSWYEAEAYAAFTGKSLPTVYHWSRNAFTVFHSNHIIPHSNFSRTGTVPVGSLPGINRFGCQDMAGNVREWTLNETVDHKSRYILGGAYDDPPYLSNEATRMSPIDRSPGNGFRCIKVLPGDTSLTFLGRPLDKIFRDYSKESPAGDNTYKHFQTHFDYDRTPLNPGVTLKFDTAYFTAEYILLDPVEGKEKQPFYLFLPKNVKPPFRTIFFWPGSNTIGAPTFNQDDASLFDFLPKGGYAVAFPIFRGTFERSDVLRTSNHDLTLRYRQYATDWIKHVRRTLDYLDTRDDIVHRYGYFGYSWGGAMSPIVLATDNRFSVAVLHVGGLRMEQTLPEVDPINFLPRVHVPVLMLNGSYDVVFPYEHSQKYMYQWLGTPPDQKKLLLFEGGHIAPRSQLIKESLTWFDRYLSVANQ